MTVERIDSEALILALAFRRAMNACPEGYYPMLRPNKFGLWGAQAINPLRRHHAVLTGASGFTPTEALDLLAFRIEEKTR